MVKLAARLADGITFAVGANIDRIRECECERERRLERRVVEAVGGVGRLVGSWDEVVVVEASDADRRNAAGAGLEGRARAGW